MERAVMTGEWSVRGSPGGQGVSGQCRHRYQGRWLVGQAWARRLSADEAEAIRGAFACRTRGGGTPDVQWPAAHEAEAVRRQGGSRGVVVRVALRVGRRRRIFTRTYFLLRQTGVGS